MENKINPALVYGAKHTKRYRPSVISSVLCDVDENGNLQALHSDAYFLLRQKNLHEKIGVEAIRTYLDRMGLGASSPDGTNLSDDELIALIPPKDVDNLTDVWKYGRYLQEKGKEILEKAKEAHARHKSYSDYKRKYQSYDDPDEDKKNE